LVLGEIHARAVERRTAARAQEEGYVPYGASSGEGFLYDLGAWLLDSTNAADRAVSVDRRFNIVAWRARIRSAANTKRPGQTLTITWQVGRCSTDILGNQVIDDREVVYEKRPDGSWAVRSGNSAGTPNLNDVISESVSDGAIQSIMSADPCSA